MMELSPSQQKILDSWDQGIAVVAGAGSGKTTTLLLKVQAFLKRNPKARIAAVSFTERSTRDLQDRLRPILDLHQHWVLTIHGLCRRVIQEMPTLVGCDGQEKILDEREASSLWERALDRLWYESVPQEVETALTVLLERESLESVRSLLTRVRELRGFGAEAWLKQAKDHDTHALNCIASYSLELYDRYKRKAGGLDFNDLEIFARRLLEEQSVRQHFHKELDLILVDEFQDTNPTQAAIVTALARPDASNLIVVGDPKQSIYGFRDADVNLFEEFCQTLPVQVNLNWNFRSRPGILQLVNKVCAPVFEASHLTYQALEARRDSSETAQVLRLNLSEPEALADWFHREVQSGKSLQDYVLLLRRVRGGEKWIQALSKRGISLALGSGGMFWEDPRVRELLALLRWWIQPSQRLSALTFFRAPWVEVEDETLDDWIYLGKDLSVAFFESQHPVAEALREFRTQDFRPGTILERLLELPWVEEDLGVQVLGLWHRCESLSLQGLSFAEVVAQLSHRVIKGERDSTVPPPRDQNQLQVMTIHGAKGLEFPQVVLVDFDGKMRARDAPLLFWDRKRGAYLGKRTEDGGRDTKDPLEKEWRDLERRKNLAESKRLFYVALTRAKERLVLAFLKQEDLAELSEKVYQEDHWRGWIEWANPILTSEEFSAVPEAALQSIRNLDSTPRVWTPVPVQKVSWNLSRHSVSQWMDAALCERKVAWSVFGAPEMAEDSSPEKTNGPVRPFSEVGTQVHACLEAWGEAEEDKLRALEEEWGADQFRADPLIEWANQSPWLGVKPSWKELAFEVKIENSVLVGAIDRVVQTEDAWTVLDFKITRSAKSPEAMVRRYEVQLWLYAWALGHLEPESRKTLRALLVVIDPDQVREVEVPLPAWEELNATVENLHSKVMRVLNEKAAEAEPGDHCRHCKVRVPCQGE